MNYIEDMKKKRLNSDLNVDQMQYVSDEEDGDRLNSSKDDLEEKIDRLTALMNQMVVRMSEYEKKLLNNNSSSTSSPTSSSKTTSTQNEQLKSTCNTKTGKYETFLVKDKYKCFTKGALNPKGGVYTFQYLEKVYLKDEKLEGVITDETAFYFRVRVSGETKFKGADGRLKLKHKVCSLR